jgi:hypothetical protein
MDKLGGELLRPDEQPDNSRNRAIRNGMDTSSRDVALTPLTGRRKPGGPVLGWEEKVAYPAQVRATGKY